MDITWTSSTAKNFSDPTAWDSGTVPGIGETAILTGSGDCLMDVATTGVLKFAAAYTGTFDANGKTFACEGIDASATLSGVIDIRNAIITNSGDFRIEGTTTTTLPVSGCQLTMTGGTEISPSVFRDVEYNAVKYQRRFNKITVEQDSHVRFETASGTTRLMLNPVTLDVYGHCTASREVWSYNTTTRFNEGSSWQSGYLFSQYAGSFYGYDMTNFAPSRLQTYGTVSLLLNHCSVNVQTGHQSATNWTTTLKAGSTLLGNLALSTNMAATQTVVFENDVTLYGDLTNTTTSGGTLVVTGGLMLAGTADQTMNIGDNAIGLAADKTAGTVTLTSGDYALTDDSTFGGGIIFAAGFAGTFTTNGNTMVIASEKLHLKDINLEQYQFSGAMVFAGHDFVLKNTILPDDCVLVFTTHCTARFITEKGKHCAVGGMCVEEDAILALTTKEHSKMTGEVLDELEISGDMTVKGTLAFYDPGQYRIVMSGEEKICQLGKLVAGSGAEIRVEPGSNAVQPIGLDVQGNVHLFWEPETTTLLLLPGNYAAFSELCIPFHITDCGFHSGEYSFSLLNIVTPQSGAILLSQKDDGDVVFHGQTKITGTGICQNAIDFLRLEHLLLNAPLLFTTDCMQIDHPVVQNGSISGNGRLMLSGTQPFLLDVNSLDVGELLLFNGDGNIPVPARGYQSLALEARSRNSFFSMQGEYHIAALTMIADTRTLTVDVDQTTTIHCSGSMTTQVYNGGNIRWRGNGLETWVFEGNTSQTIGMTLEHGYHLLGTVLNKKASGDVTILLPLSVVYYRKSDGTPLPALANMTILSAVTMKGHLFLVTSSSEQCLSQEGMKLEKGTAISGGTAAFYAQLADREGQPLNPNLVEWIEMDCTVMNPTAPYLHAPRSTVVRNFPLEIPHVLSPAWQTDDNRLPEGQTYNFYMNSAMLRELRFDRPGLYYVTFAVKLFGYQNAVLFRYEILCERPVVNG